MTLVFGICTASAAFGMVKLKGLWPIMVAKRRLQTSHAFWTLTLEGETNPVDIFFRLVEGTFRSSRNLLEK